MMALLCVKHLSQMAFEEEVSSQWKQGKIIVECCHLKWNWITSRVSSIDLRDALGKHGEMRSCWAYMGVIHCWSSFFFFHVVTGSVIEREVVLDNQRTFEESGRGFHLQDAMWHCKSGIEVCTLFDLWVSLQLTYLFTPSQAIIEDEVTKRFDAEGEEVPLLINSVMVLSCSFWCLIAELSSWNLLTRTNMDHQFIRWALPVVYL